MKIYLVQTEIIKIKTKIMEFLVGLIIGLIVGGLGVYIYLSNKNKKKIVFTSAGTNNTTTIRSSTGTIRSSVG